MGDVYLPILKDTNDAHYRYKMPKLCAKVEGSGNGIKTVITNMVAIAKALERPASYPTKYFGCELGAQVTMANDNYIVNGSHDPEKLLKLLYDFIKRFVLCTKCNNPETSLNVVNKTIRQKCIACGHEAPIKDTTHRLTTYIINHPPNSSATSKTNGKSKSGKSKSKVTNGNGSNSPTGGQNGDSGNDLNKNDNANDEFDDFDEEDFTTDAYAERMRELCDGFTSTKIMVDKNESANLFYKLVKEKKEAGLLLDTNVQKELLSEAERLEIKDKAILVVSELLFSENMFDEIKQYRVLLLRFCNENHKAQKYLMGGFEKLVGDVFVDKLLNSAVKILKQFYDEDILDEEVIIEWAAKESKKYVSKEMSKKIHEKVAPFIKWLKEADVEEDESDEDNESDGAKPTEPVKTNGTTAANKKQQASTQSSKQQQQQDDDDDDEDDDDGIDLEFSHRVSGIQLESVKPVVQVKAVNADVVKETAEEGEDIDIDNI